MTKQQETRGRGMLHVTSDVWASVGKPATPDQWRKALLLPDTYEVERVSRCSCPSTGYTLALLTTAIPLDGTHIAQVEIIPSYQLNEEKKPELTKIEIRQWNGEEWLDITTEVFVGV